MPTPITGVPGASHTSPITFNAPADTDAAVAASVIVPFQALADVVSHHQADSASQAGNNTFAGSNAFAQPVNVAAATAAAHAVRKDQLEASTNLLGGPAYALTISVGGAITHSRGSVTGVSVDRNEGYLYTITDARISTASVLFVTQHGGTTYTITAWPFSGHATVELHDAGGTRVPGEFLVLVIP